MRRAGTSVHLPVKPALRSSRSESSSSGFTPGWPVLVRKVRCSVGGHLRRSRRRNSGEPRERSYYSSDRQAAFESAWLRFSGWPPPSLLRPRRMSRCEIRLSSAISPSAQLSAPCPFDTRFPVLTRIHLGRQAFRNERSLRPRPHWVSCSGLMSSTCRWRMPASAYSGKVMRLPSSKIVVAGARGLPSLSKNCSAPSP